MEGKRGVEKFAAQSAHFDDITKNGACTGVKVVALRSRKLTLRF
jgi:hypothetical protein